MSKKKLKYKGQLPIGSYTKDAFGIYGTFHIQDDSCKSTWGGWKDNGCSREGKRLKSSVIHVPKPYDWDKMCQTTPLTGLGAGYDGKKVGDVKGQAVGCTKKINGMWAEIDVSDSSCNSSWGTWKDNGCKRPGFREKASKINVAGTSWEDACNNIKVAGLDESVNGKTVSQAKGGAAGCVKNNGMWAEIDIPDKSCAPSIGEWNTKCLDKGSCALYAQVTLPSTMKWEKCDPWLKAMGDKPIGQPLKCMEAEPFTPKYNGFPNPKLL